MRLRLTPSGSKKFSWTEALAASVIILFTGFLVLIIVFKHRSKPDGLVVSYIFRSGANAIMDAALISGSFPISDDNYFPDAVLEHMELYHPGREQTVRFKSAGVFDPFTPHEETEEIREYTVYVNQKPYRYTAQPMRYFYGEHGFILQSRGADGDYDLKPSDLIIPDVVVDEGEPIKGYERYAYDPSNGTRSSGDLFYLVPLNIAADRN